MLCRITNYKNRFIEINPDVCVILLIFHSDGVFKLVVLTPHNLKNMGEKLRGYILNIMFRMSG